MKLGQSIQFKLKTIGSKPALVSVVLKNPKNRYMQLVKKKILANKPMVTPNIKFNIPGKYQLVMTIGSTKRYVNVSIALK